MSEKEEHKVDLDEFFVQQGNHHPEIRKLLNVLAYRIQIQEDMANYRISEKEWLDVMIRIIISRLDVDHNCKI